MRNNFQLGEHFLTVVDLSFKGFEIPVGTLFEIIETNVDGDDYKVYFHQGDDEECIQVMSFDEIEYIRCSVMAEY